MVSDLKFGPSSCKDSTYPASPSSVSNSCFFFSFFLFLFSPRHSQGRRNVSNFEGASYERTARRNVSKIEGASFERTARRNVSNFEGAGYERTARRNVSNIEGASYERNACRNLSNFEGASYERTAYDRFIYFVSNLRQNLDGPIETWAPTPLPSSKYLARNFFPPLFFFLLLIIAST